MGDFFTMIEIARQNRIRFVRRAVILICLSIAMISYVVGCVDLPIARADTLEPIEMKEMYIGEEKGKYIEDSWGGSWVHVEYFDEHAQNAALVRMRDSRLYTNCGDLLSGSYLFVVDLKERLLATDRAEYGKIHHSSLVAGQAVLSAGTLFCKAGKPIYISDLSGHYRPSAKHYKYVCQMIKKGLK